MCECLMNGVYTMLCVLWNVWCLGISTWYVGKCLGVFTVCKKKLEQREEMKINWKNLLGLEVKEFKFLGFTV